MTGGNERRGLTKERLQWLILALGALIFLGFGAARAFHFSNDFVPVYTGARCLLHGCNPYETKQLEREFFKAGGIAQELPSWEIDVPVYPPSTFLAVSPLALLPYSAARSLWFLLNGSLFVGSAVLIISICPSSHRWLAVAVGRDILDRERPELARIVVAQRDRPDGKDVLRHAGFRGRLRSQHRTAFL